MARRATVLLTAGLLLAGCATPTTPPETTPLVSPSDTTSATDTVTRLHYREVPAWRFLLPGQDGHVFVSSDGVTECRLRISESGTSGECLSAATAQEESSLIVFDEQQPHNGEFSADRGAESPGWTPLRTVGSLPPGRMMRLGTVICLSPAEGAIACLSEKTGDGFRLTGHRYDTFHRGGERFGL